MNDSFNPAPPQATRILLVDANVSVRERCAALLQRAGYRVDAQNGAAAGWQAVREKGYDLLVIDYQLPGGSGLRLIARIRTAHITLPVILLAETALADELDRNPRLRLSATINRPFTAEQLLETAVAVLQNSRPNTVDSQSLVLIGCD